MKKIILLILTIATTFTILSNTEVNANVDTLDPDLEPKVNDFTNATMDSVGSFMYVITEDHRVYKKHTYTESLIVELDISHFNDNVFNEGEHFVQFAGSSNVYIGLTNEGRLFSWGTYFYGELGNGMKEYVWEEPTIGGGGSAANPLDYYVEIENAYEITGEYSQVKSVGMAIYALTTGGELHAWGNQSFNMNAGYDDEVLSVPTPMYGAHNLNDGEKVIDFHIDTNHILVVTNQNRIITAGSVSYGQLGNGTYTNTDNYPDQKAKYNPLKGDPVIALDILEEGDVVTDVVLSEFMGVIVNNEDLWLWGSLYRFIDDDFRTVNADSIEYINDESNWTDYYGRNNREVFVHPVQFDVEFDTLGKVLSLSQGQHMVLFSNDGEILEYGDPYHYIEDYPTDIIVESMTQFGSATFYLREGQKGLFLTSIFGTHDVSKLYFSSRVYDSIYNKSLPKHIRVSVPSLHNPVGYDYSYLITISDVSGNILYSTEADNNMNELIISDENDAIPKGLLKEDTLYIVDVYLYYYVDGIKIGPFEFISHEVTTMPPLGEVELTAVNVLDDTTYINRNGEMFDAYQVNVKLEQTYYAINQYYTGLRFILFDDTSEAECDTVFDNGLCLVQDADIYVASGEGYSSHYENYTEHRKYRYSYSNDNYQNEGRYNMSSFNLDTFGNVYFIGLDSSVNYTYRVYMNSTLFGDLIDEGNPSQGRDGFLGEFEIDWDLSYKLPPSITVGTEEYTDRGIKIPLTEVEDLTDAILRNEVYFNVCDEDMFCELYWEDISDEVELDGLEAGNYTVEVYYEYNVNDNTGINKEVLGTYNLTIETGAPIVELGDLELNNDDISIDIDGLSDLDNTLVGTDIYVDLCIDDICETTTEDLNSNDIDVKNIDYGVYDIRVYIEYDLGDGTEELTLLEEEVSYLPEFNSSINVNEDEILIQFGNDNEVEVIDEQYHIEVCTGGVCTDTYVNDTDLSHVLSNLDNGDYTIKVNVILENDIANYTHTILEETMTVNVNKEDASITLGEIETTKDSITIPITNVTDTDGVIIDNKIFVEYCLDDVCETVDVTTDTAGIVITQLEKGTYQLKVYVQQDKDSNSELILLETSVDIGSTSGCKASLTIGSSLIGIIGLFGGAIIVIRKYFI